MKSRVSRARRALLADLEGVPVERVAGTSAAESQDVSNARPQAKDSDAA